MTRLVLFGSRAVMVCLRSGLARYFRRGLVRSYATRGVALGPKKGDRGV